MKQGMFERLEPAIKRGRFTKHDQTLAQSIVAWALKFGESVSNDNVPQAQYDYFRLRKCQFGDPWKKRR